MRLIDADALWKDVTTRIEEYCDIADLIEIIERQPTIEPEQRWIPRKTALPEKGQYVLCQCRAGIMDVLRLTDDNGWYKDSTHIYMHGFVLAWMPLPEAYKGGEEDDKQGSNRIPQEYD